MSTLYYSIAFIALAYNSPVTRLVYLWHLEESIMEVVKLDHKNDDERGGYEQVDEQVLSTVLLQTQIL